MNHQLNHYYRRFYSFDLSRKQTVRVFSEASFLCLKLSFKLSSKLFSNVLMALAPLLLLPYSLDSQALSANTSNVIYGTGPYLTFDNGVTKARSIENLLSIKLSNGQKITPQDNLSTPTNPIELPNVGERFTDIGIMIPPSTNSVSLIDLVTTYGYWGDDDGDGDLTASGTLTVNITDRNGKVINNRSNELDVCSAPYKVVLTSNGGRLTTRYGEPKDSYFGSDAATYYITPKSSPVICFVKPSLRYGKDYSYAGGSNYKGPDNIWNPTNGFIPQSTSYATYDSNFPTTGANGLYFDLEVRGGDGKLTWAPVTHEGITASISIPPTRSSINTSSVRVTLKGPEASSQIHNNNPSQISQPVLPQTFELIGRDNSGNEVKYGFVLQKWFVNRGRVTDNPSNQTAWCNNIGYRIIEVKDVTNAICSGSSIGSCQGIVSAMPSSIGNYYQRRIGAGLFTEWGYMKNYKNSNFFADYYWTGDATGNKKFKVHSNSGYISYSYTSPNRHGLCVSP